MRFKYCPKCGNKLIEKELGDEGLVPFCTNCNEPFFDIFSTCTIALVCNEYNEVALLKQSYISDTYYNLVSGYMKPNETAEYTCTREIEEEIGIKIDSLKLVKTIWFNKKGILMIGFIARCKKTQFTLSKEVDEAIWVPIEKAINMVHPKGSSSYELCDILLNNLKNY